jgi:hypothetical protein
MAAAVLMPQLFDATLQQEGVCAGRTEFELTTLKTQN